MGTHPVTGADQVTARLADVSATLRDLQALVAEEESLDAALDRLARTAVRTIPDAAQVSVTLVAGGHASTAAATAPVLHRIDRAQYETGAGPCVEAARERRPVRVGVDTVRDRWPAFTAAAAAAGIRAYLSAPLAIDGEEPVLGALNLYGRRRDAFEPLDEALVTLFTTAASAAIMNARRYRRFRELAANLSQALLTRAEIDQAKGVLMARHGVSAEEAFALLAARSQHANVKLHEVAAALLASVRAGREPG